MAKLKSVYVCSSCGHQSPKWQGQCSSCDEWNTYNEEIVHKKSTSEVKPWTNNSKKDSKPQLIEDIKIGHIPRISTGNSELDRVLGGGLVPGSLVLLGGQPGIGKSTLLLQIASSLNKKVLYISGEESKEQIKMRALRISVKNNLLYISTETSTEKIISSSEKIDPDLIIVDSIQTLSSPSVDSVQGSVSQIRESTNDLQKIAKDSNVPIFIIGHITKEGSIAGPKILEHIVDVVLQFEGDRHHLYRMIRTTKNRYGSTEELAIYEMKTDGLRAVTNPSEFLISQSEEKYSGSAIAATIEGMRPMLAETQALVSDAIYGTPQRSSTGYDLRRLHMVLAVIEKKAALYFGQKDVFLNIAGGIKITDPAIDLSIIASLISSHIDIPIDKKFCFVGEVGLSGEIRTVSRLDQRIQEAAKLGFTHIFVPKNNIKKTLENASINIVGVKNIKELNELLFS
jgi:DNA repair protein RadA/Sms